MPLEQSALSLQYIFVPVRARFNGTRYDPSTDVVKMAFPLTGVDPITGDWKTADWETRGSTHYARCLVGPTGAFVPVADTQCDILVKVTDNPETPVIKADTVSFT